MTSQPFRNDSTYDERAEQHRQDELPKPASTYFAMAAAGVDLTLSGEASGGGYVAGSEPFVRYPRQPAGGLWSVDAGIEPPTGVDISAVEPVGTAKEIEASLELAGPQIPVPRGGEITGSPVVPRDPAIQTQDGLASPSVAPAAASGSGPPAVTSPAASAMARPSSPEEAHARLAELAPKMFRRRRV